MSSLLTFCSASISTSSSSQIPFSSVWSSSSHCRCSRLQQLCQHIQDESKLLCPDFPHFSHHPAFGSRDVTALFPWTRGYCHSSEEQTHSESWWESELHTMVQIFIFITFPELFCQTYFQIHTYLSFLVYCFVIFLLLTNYKYKYKVLRLFYTFLKMYLAEEWSQ